MAGNQEVTDLPGIPAVDGADVYAAKNNLDYRIRTGEAGGLATLDGTGKLSPAQFPSVVTFTNITLTGTPQFFKADFTTAGTQAYFQTTTPNNATNIAALPSGTAQYAAWSSYNTSNITTNYEGIQLVSQPTVMAINSISAGTGTLRPISFQFNTVEKANLSAVGTFNAQGRFQTPSGHFNSLTTTAVLSAESGPVVLRPNGQDNTANQYTFQANGLALSPQGFQADGSQPFIIGTTGLAYIPSNAGHIAYYKKNTSNTFSFYWRRSDNGFPSGPNEATLMELRDNALFFVYGQIHSQGATGGYQFNDRTSSRAWTMYGTADNITFFNGAGNIAFIDPSGNHTATNFFATSDRYKKDKIEDKSARRNLADKLRLVSFIWKSDGMPDQGVIAQEVREVAPEYVKDGPDGFLTVDKVGLLLECVVDLAARVSELEAKQEE